MAASRKPPYEVTPRVVELVAELMRLVGRYEGGGLELPGPQLRRENRIRTIHGTLAIEGNTLSEAQITAILEGKRVVGPARDIAEVRNAEEAYARAARLDPSREKDLLATHGVLMRGLLPDAGRYRKTGVGVVQGSRIAHVAPPPKRVPELVADLLRWAKTERSTHPLVKAAVLHYELEFIHPFTDGNGRIGRLWQHVALVRFHPAFAYVPVESVIRARQSGYYDVLARCDRAGSSTEFVEFALDALRGPMEDLLDRARPERSTTATRLDAARRAFGSREFSRREYLAENRDIATATASRDLRDGVEQRLLGKRGTKALARYRFR